MDALIGFFMVIGVMAIGLDVLSKAFGPGVNKLYRRTVRWVGRQTLASLRDFVRWALPHVGRGVRGFWRWLNT